MTKGTRRCVSQGGCANCRVNSIPRDGLIITRVNWLETERRGKSVLVVCFGLSRDDTHTHTHSPEFLHISWLICSKAKQILSFLATSDLWSFHCALLSSSFWDCLNFHLGSDQLVLLVLTSVNSRCFKNAVPFQKVYVPLLTILLALLSI